MGSLLCFFRGTREQIVFGEEDLRLHREWENGEWQPPLEGVQEEKEEEEVKEREKKDEAKDEVVSFALLNTSLLFCGTS